MDLKSIATNLSQGTIPGVDVIWPHIRFPLVIYSLLQCERRRFLQFNWMGTILTTCWVWNGILSVGLETQPPITLLISCCLQIVLSCIFCKHCRHAQLLIGANLAEKWHEETAETKRLLITLFSTNNRHISMRRILECHKHVACILTQKPLKNFISHQGKTVPLFQYDHNLPFLNYSYN